MDVDPSKYNKLDSTLPYRTLELHSLTLEDLKKVTKKFSDEQLLGEGGFGEVYEGMLQNGDMVVVKKLMSTMSDTKDRQFENEVHHLMSLKNPNIVQLLSYCSRKENILAEYNGKCVYAEKSEKLLCLEYLPNGTSISIFRIAIKNTDESYGFDWGIRYKIMEGICNGLHYLQDEWHVTPIIHMDLKPITILLDDNMVPKIVDFGLSRLFREDNTKTCTLNHHGTLIHRERYNHKKVRRIQFGCNNIEIITGHKDYLEPGETRTSSQELIEHVLERDYVMKFQEVITQLEKSLHDFPFDL